MTTLLDAPAAPRRAAPDGPPPAPPGDAGDAGDGRGPRRPRRRVLAAVVAGLIAVVGVALIVGGPPSGPSSGVARVGGTGGPDAAHPSGTARSGAASGAAGTGAGSLAGGGAGGAVAAPGAPTAQRGAAAPAAPAPSFAAPAAPAAPAPQAPLDKVVKTGSLDVAVSAGRLGTTMDRLTGLATGEGGFVSHTQVSQGGSFPSGSVTLRVPAGAFEDTLTKARAMGKVVSVTTQGDEVTAQYVDLTARIDALQTARQQYLTILSRATAIGDILAVQQQIDALQTQIEQLQGQQRVLDDQTTYGTLAVTVSEATGPQPPPVREAAPSGWSHAWHLFAGRFLAGLQGLVAVSGVVLFIAFLGGILGGLGWIVWRAVRRRRDRVVV